MRCTCAAIKQHQRNGVPYGFGISDASEAEEEASIATWAETADVVSVVGNFLFSYCISL